MPEYNQGGGGEDMYSDAAAAPESGAATAPQPKDEGEQPRGVLPKAILAGKDFKPGDEIVLKIDAIHDDEVEVSYAPEKPGGGEGGGEYGEQPAGGGDAEMSGMME